jgi:hypothetical protein
VDPLPVGGLPVGFDVAALAVEAVRVDHPPRFEVLVGELEARPGSGERAGRQDPRLLGDFLAGRIVGVSSVVGVVGVVGVSSVVGVVGVVGVSSVVGVVGVVGVVCVVGVARVVGFDVARDAAPQSGIRPHRVGPTQQQDLAAVPQEAGDDVGLLHVRGVDFERLEPTGRTLDRWRL